MATMKRMTTDAHQHNQMRN